MRLYDALITVNMIPASVCCSKEQEQALEKVVEAATKFYADNEVQAPQTNFDRITESPEALAKTIFGVIKNSETCECPAFTLCNGSGAKISCESTIVKWLNQEVSE